MAKIKFEYEAQFEVRFLLGKFEIEKINIRKFKKKLYMLLNLIFLGIVVFFIVLYASNISNQVPIAGIAQYT